MLARLLNERGDEDGLRARAGAGDTLAAEVLADLLANRGDLDELQVRADAGDRYATDRLVRLLVERGNPDGERRRRWGLRPDGTLASEADFT